MASGFYDITSKTLGKGHYGVVKIGRHCLTGEPVAVKIIEKSKLNNDSLHQLGTEIRILFRLSEYEHPNILKLYQTIDTENKLFLITEYCGPNACDLHEYLSRKHSRGGLSEIEAQMFFVQICSAISYCHSMGIVHRDLKPENILVTDYRHMHSHSKERDSSQHENQYPLLKLIDFGFANQWYPDEKMRTSCGTLAYSAPELLLGEPYDGTKVDVWGLGLMLYILLYGGNPFMQINDNETLTKILDCSFTTPPKENVNNEAVDLLRSLIKRNPDTRLSIDAILRHKWLSNVPKPLELTLKYQIKSEQSSSSKQLAKFAPVVSPTLPSISESGPLKNLNRSVDDEQLRESCKTTDLSHNRTRSLSITRSHSKLNQQQSSQTRSNTNLERLNQNSISSLSPIISRDHPIYRPTSPDVGGSAALSEEELEIHDRVIQDMFKLTKLINSKSSIEASLKNARFAHRLFNQSSIEPAQMGKKKIFTGLVKSLVPTKALPNLESVGDNQVDKLSVINSKLSNDDYIYATYQLTRDKILRVDKEHLSRRLSGDESNHNRKDLGGKVISDKVLLQETSESNQQQETNNNGVFQMSAKENNKDQSSLVPARKLLQPQHRMKDKFTSFFRSGSISPSGSLGLSLDCQQLGLREELANQEIVQHEAFSDHDNDPAGSTGRYFSNKIGDSFENAMAYALPLARKCSLVSEESGCSNGGSEGQ